MVLGVDGIQVFVLAHQKGKRHTESQFTTLGQNIIC